MIIYLSCNYMLNENNKWERALAEMCIHHTGMNTMDKWTNDCKLQLKRPGSDTFIRWPYLKHQRTTNWWPSLFSFSELNSIESAETVEFAENYFYLFWKWKLLKKIVFYKFYRFCRMLNLITLKMKITKNSFLQIL